jgi:acyl-coenzyme A thioesterase PaaI-like protein
VFPSLTGTHHDESTLKTRTMNDDLARAALERAISSYEPEFGAFCLAHFLDLQFTSPSERCVIEFPVHHFVSNPNGLLRRGITATEFDISMAHLLRHQHGGGGSTLQLNIQDVRALRNGTARCEADFIRRGRGIAFLQTRLYADALQIAASTTSIGKIPAPESIRS